MAQPLSINIAGAGIGGLCAAIGLRQQGHNVNIFEQSSLAKEVGAALHIAPNANGLLQRIGINPRDHGSVELHGIVSLKENGKVLHNQDMQESNKMWQHPWDLMHRAHLHSALKEKAISEGVILHTASPVESVDASSATVTLKHGETHQGDLVIGADGVHSKTRKAISDIEAFDSGKSAYRFLLSTKEMSAYEELKPLINSYLHIWIGKDRRLVMYPCEGGATMNLAAIFPSQELVADGEGWSRRGSKDNLLKLYTNFEKRVQTILNLVEEPQAWTLLDMDQLPTFVKDKLALLGDAAHPFLPHQAQGGAQAIEDGMSLAALLPLGTTPQDIPARLQLYEDQRYERSHKVQEFTRLTGEDVVKEVPDFGKFVPYNVGHDEWHASTNALQQHLARGSTHWHTPAAYGPITEPQAEAQSQLVIRFKSSRTYLQDLLPTGVTFTSPATICEASLVCTTSECFGTSHSLALIIHGIQRNGTSGSFIALTLDDSIDSILASREAKQFCNIAVTGTTVDLSWHGTSFGSIKLTGLTTDAQSSTSDENYSAWSREESKDIDATFSILVGEDVEASIADKASVQFSALDEQSLPTLHGFIKVLAEMPNYGLVRANTLNKR